MRKLFLKHLSSALAIALAFIVLLSACGGSSVSMDAADNRSVAAGEEYSRESPSSPGGTGDNDYDYLAGAKPQILNSDKIIYSGIATIETQSFDKTIEDIEKLISGCGGYIQSSAVQGDDYFPSSHGTGYRSASYVLRIPVEIFKDVVSELSLLGNMPYRSINADNITLQYTDAQARLKTRETEEARLLELLTEAESVDEILSIEHYLSDVRYEIESLTGQIKGWDNQISFSSLTLNVSEVSLYTEGASGSEGYGSQLVSALTGSARQVWHFLKNLLKGIVTALPVLAMVLIIAVPLFFLARTIVKRKAWKSSKVPKGSGKTDEQ